jgi:hypothetical protein
LQALEYERLFKIGSIAKFGLYQIIHTEGDVGKTCYYRCYYENTPGKRGPQSFIMSAVVG